MVNLGSTVNGKSSRADAVSGDGKVVVGFQEHPTGFWQGARWVDGQQTLFTGPLGLVGQAFDTEPATGRSSWARCAVPATHGTRAGGCGRSETACSACPSRGSRARSIEGGFLGRAQATSDDGRVIGGGHAFGLESEAVLWLDKQPFYLKDYLRDARRARRLRGLGQHRHHRGHLA